VAWERSAPPKIRYYGLGARYDAAVELRGTRTAALKPFLISTAGYGEKHVASGKFTFDIARTKPDRYRIEARGATKVDYYFFLGPTPKEILEQNLLVDGAAPPFSSNEFDLLHPSKVPAEATLLSGSTLAETIHSFINGSLSGVLMPAFSIDSF